MRRSRALRLLLAVGLAIGVVALPIERAAACSCLEVELPDAIRSADVAVVARLTERSGPSGDEPMVEELNWTWTVERTRAPIEGDRLTVTAAPEDGANCGVTFGIGERWLLLATLHGGRLDTNGCMRNQRMDGSDPESEALISELVPLAVTAGGETASGPPIPGPLALALGAVAIIVLVAIVGFRRDAR